MPRSPEVTVFIPTPLRRYCGNASELRLRSPDLRTLLEELERQFPDLYRGVCDDTGAVRRHINIFVNNEHMREYDGIETKLKTGDAVTIMTAVSGG